MMVIKEVVNIEMDNILLVSRVFPPKTGGIENYIYNIHSRLDNVTVITPEYDGSEEFDRNRPITIKRVAIRQKAMRRDKLPLFFLFFAAFKYTLKYRPKQIHCDQVQSGFIGYCLHLLLGKPFIVFTYGKEISGGGSRKLKSFVLKRAQAVVTISQFTKKVLISRLNVEENKIILIAPGTNIDRYKPGLDYSQLLNNYHLENKKIILSVGRLDKDSLYKNFDSVIKIMPRILKKIPEAVYVVVGSGNDQGRLKRLARESDVSDKVIFTGRLSDAALAKMYNACDIFVMAGKDEAGAGKIRGEGFGIVYLEANACGKPVIAGNVCGAVEAVINNFTGLLVNPNDHHAIEAAIIKLLAHQKLAVKLGEQGRERVRTNFTWEKSRETIRKLISSQEKKFNSDKSIRKNAAKDRLRLFLGSIDISRRIRQKNVFSAIDKLNPSGKKILDAGCGAGWLAAGLAYKHHNIEITGLDINPDNIAQADRLQRRLSINNIKFRQADLSRPFAYGQFDLVYCVDVLEHIKNDDAALKNLFLGLKPGGALLLHVPLSNQRRYFKRFQNRRQSDHVREGYIESNLKSLVESSGFKLIEQKYTFGWSGSFAWEAYESARRQGELFRLLTSTAMLPLALLDIRLKNKWGNALLIQAEKPIKKEPTYWKKERKVMN